LTPDFYGGRANFSIAAISRSNVWAAGGLSHGTSSTALLARWDGRRWTRAPLRMPGVFLDIDARSANDVWAVGGDFDAGRALIAHWNGKRWRVVRDGRFYELSDVVALAPHDVWAIAWRRRKGRDSSYVVASVRHWNGRVWKTVHIRGTRPATDLGERIEAIDGSSSRDVWAVGYVYRRWSPEREAVAEAVAFHWDGARWARAPLPRSRYRHSSLEHVAVGSGSTALALVWTNKYNDPHATGYSQPYNLLWNGTRWTNSAPAQRAGATDLEGIVAAPGGGYWAWSSGYGVASPKAFIARWDSRQWVAGPPVPRTVPGNGRLALAPTRDGALWFTGEREAFGSYETVVARRDCS